MLLDSYAWIEYFLKTPKGERVKEMLTHKECFTSAISLAELSDWCEKHHADRSKQLQFVKNLSTILDLDYELLESGGVIKNQKRKTIPGIGLIDCLIIATGQRYNLPIVTDDKHFQGENTVFL